MKRLLLQLMILLVGGNFCAQGLVQQQEINVDQVYSQYGLSGKGVVVVMIDRGIDYSHPAFLDENGNTRIEYIYDMVDQSGANASGNPYGIGTIHSRSAIDAAIDNNTLPPLSDDRHGHGTATTGIICGNGAMSDGMIYSGIAPEATIISIKITHDFFPAFEDQPGQNGFFNPDYIETALQFAGDKIEELGMPSITLMNIGSIGGVTDGTSKVCRWIDDYVGRGHPFVIGTGDDGGNDNVASGTIGQGETIDIRVQKNEAGNLRFDLWYAESDRFTVSIIRPNGNTEGPFSPPGNSNQTADQNLGDIFIGHRGANTEFSGSTAEKRELLIDMSGATGTYTIRLKGDQTSGGGDFRATLNPSIYSNSNKFLNYVFPGGSIADYAAASKAIVVGDYVIDQEWTDIDGMRRSRTGEGDIGELWVGSSIGPDAEGRQVIDVVAPGEVSIGPYSDDTWYSNFRFNIVQQGNGFYGIQNAVSAANPIVTGVIALMLEANRFLTPDRIKTILQSTSRSDSFTGSTPNDRYGYGKLDALAAVQEAFETTNVKEPESIESIKIYPHPVVNEFNIMVGDETYIGNVKGSLFNTQGERVMMINNNTGSINVSGLQSGIYFLQLNTGSGWSTHKLLKY